jgi:hypothetical protein
MSKRRWYVLTALAFALHNAEEAAFAARMLDLMQSRAPMFLRGFYSGIQASDLRASLLVLTVIALLLAALASRSPSAPGWSYVMLLMAAVIGLNALAHLGLAISFGTYMPGLITALVLTLPVSVAVLARGRRETWVAPGTWWTLLPAAVVVHGPVLAVFIRASIGALRMFA